jgi:preprotein translocase subunit SecY
MTLGIGPIVTSGIILQLLVGSKIIGWDLTKKDSRRKFQVWSKLLAVVFCFIEAGAFVLFGAVPVAAGSGLGLLLFVILQVAVGGIIVIILDDLVSKWGFGSGVSLFIVAGVASQLIIGFVSPISVQGRYAGAIPGLIASIAAGNMSLAIGYLIPMIATIAIFFVVVFVQHVAIDIPLVFTTMRGFGRTWSLKFLYTSVIPVILIAALIANVQILGKVGLSQKGDLSCGMLGCYDAQGNAVSGAAYYLSKPRNLLLDVITKLFFHPTQNLHLVNEAIRAITYTVFLSLGAMIFSIFWVRTSGMDAKSVANQLDSSGMQIPGYRRDPRIMEAVLNKYIPALAVMGGIAIGLLAAVSDALGAIGTGTGILLTVMITYNYYEMLGREKLDEAHPIIRKIVGE